VPAVSAARAARPLDEPPWDVDAAATARHDRSMAHGDEVLDPPCPCASGRRLRGCCGLADGPDERAGDWDPVLERLITFGARGEFATARRRANRALLAELPGEQIETLARSCTEPMQVATLYLLHADVPCVRGDTLAALLLRREGAAMPPRQRSLLANLVACPSSLFEVVEVFRDQGMVLRDLLRRFTVRVRERKASTVVKPGWLLLTRVRRQPDGMPVVDMPLLEFRGGQRKPVDAWLAAQRGADPDAGLDPRAVLAELYRIWQRVQGEALARPALPTQLTNEHGDPLELHEGEFRCDGRRLRAWLEAAPDWAVEAEAGGDGEGDDGPDVWIWFEPRADGLRRVLADLQIDGDRCRLEVNSRERFDRVVAKLRKAAGAELVRLDKVSGTKLMARARSRSRGRSRRGEIAPKALAEMRQQALDAHYRAWIDEPVPMFGGRTPRAMAKVDPAAVAREIWKTCHGESRVRYDARWMYAELGVPPLGEGTFTAGVDVDPGERRGDAGA
jgi:hypothetical protein